VERCRRFGRPPLRLSLRAGSSAIPLGFARGFGNTGQAFSKSARCGAPPFLSLIRTGDVGHPPYEHQVSRDRSHREQPAGAPGHRWIDWALSHPEGARAKDAPWKTKNVFHFRTGPTTAGCSHRRIMVDVRAESMVGGTIFHREVISREISRALVLNLSGKASGAHTPPRTSLPLTVPSLLSRATLQRLKG
jgi:hypothetical protein